MTCADKDCNGPGSKYGGGGEKCEDEDKVCCREPNEEEGSTCTEPPCWQPKGKACTPPEPPPTDWLKTGFDALKKAPKGAKPQVSPQALSLARQHLGINPTPQESRLEAFAKMQVAASFEDTEQASYEAAPPVSSVAAPAVSSDEDEETMLTRKLAEVKAKKARQAVAPVAVSLEGARISPLQPLSLEEQMAALPTQDNPDFRDEKGSGCGDWEGYSCSMNSGIWSYSVEGRAELIKHCPETCSGSDAQAILHNFMIEHQNDPPVAPPQPAAAPEVPSVPVLTAPEAPKAPAVNSMPPILESVNPVPALAPVPAPASDQHENPTALELGRAAQAAMEQHMAAAASAAAPAAPPKEWNLRDGFKVAAKKPAGWAMQKWPIGSLPSDEQ